MYYLVELYVLEEWVVALRLLAGQTENAYAFFNNNASSEDPDNPLGRVAQAATNAQQLRRLLDVNKIAARIKTCCVGTGDMLFLLSSKGMAAKMKCAD